MVQRLNFVLVAFASQNIITKEIFITKHVILVVAFVAFIFNSPPLYKVMKIKLSGPPFWSAVITSVIKNPFLNKFVLWLRKIMICGRCLLLWICCTSQTKQQRKLRLHWCRQPSAWQFHQSRLILQQWQSRQQQQQ